MDFVACKKSVHKGHSNCSSDHGTIIQNLSRSDEIAGLIHYHAIEKVSITPTPGCNIHHLVGFLDRCVHDRQHHQHASYALALRTLRITTACISAFSSLALALCISKHDSHFTAYGNHLTASKGKESRKGRIREAWHPFLGLRGPYYMGLQFWLGFVSCPICATACFKDLRKATLMTIACLCNVDLGKVGIS